MADKNISMYNIGCIISFVLIISVIISIRNAVVNGYEVDLYANVPLYTWISIIIVYIFAIFMLIRKSSSKDIYDKKYFRLSSVILLFLNVVILLIPNIKYTVMWDRWDSWYHVGYVIDILRTGHIDTLKNPYPGLHILETIFVYMSGLRVSELGNISFLLNPLLFSLYPVFIHILGKKMCLNDVQNTTAVCLSVPFSYVAYSQTATPLGFVATIPFNFASFFVPIITILVFNKNINKLLIVILMLTITISHMVVAISICIGFVLMKIFKTVAMYKNRYSKIHINVNNYLLCLSIILIASWLIYLTNFYISPVKAVYRAIFFGDVYAMPYNSIMNKVGVTGYYKILLILKIFTSSFILTILSLISVKRIITKIGYDTKVLRLFVSLGWFLGCSILFVLVTVLFSNLPFSSFRLLGMMFIIAPILAGYTLGSEIGNNFKNKTKFSMLICIFIIIFVVGLFAKYPSPYVNNVNWQTTEHDIRGVKWFDDHKNKSTEVAGSNYHRAILSGYIGYNATYYRDDFRDGLDMRLPKHLGYDNSTEYNKKMVNKYVLLTKFDFYFYGQRGELSSTDSDMIEDDKLFNDIYDSNEYKIYSYI